MDKSNEVKTADPSADFEAISPEKLDLAAGEITALDETELFLRENNLSHGYLQELLSDEAEVKKLVRKVDLRLLPLLAGTYVLQYLDKQALSYAAVFDLFSDTGINQDQYAWFASMFYLAYLVAEYPWSALAQRTLMGKVVAGCTIAWGVVLMATAAGNNFGSLGACRFLLGIFEAPITPCFMMIVGMWYVREEQPFRAGIFYSCNGIGSMIGGVLTYAIGQIKTFPVWKAIFLMCGGITVLWGCVLMIFLPDSIIRAKRFSLQEKATLIARGRLGRTGILNRNIKFYQIKEALLDPQVWLLFLFTLCNEIINGGFSNFGKLIIKGLVQDPLQTTALGIPQGAFQVLWILSGTWFASRFRNSRTLVMMAYLVPTIIGTSLIWKLDRKQYKVGVLIAYYIVGGFVASLVVALQMPAANLGGYTKRITGTAFVFAAYCIGNVIGPHAFLDSESPTYPTGCQVILGCSCAQLVIAAALRLLLSWRNKKRDQEAAANPSAIEDPIDEDFADLTDLENPRFRYVL
ncbi:MFS general substrate transporter [Thozetella sp. PMI_491]|nr:MFS general substrate transporter [Thozetella sp. PMI_491]